MYFGVLVTNLVALRHCLPRSVAVFRSAVHLLIRDVLFLLAHRLIMLKVVDMHTYLSTPSTNAFIRARVRSRSISHAPLAIQNVECGRLIYLGHQAKYPPSSGLKVTLIM